MERGLYADLPVTDAAAARTLALPMFSGLTGEEQKQVIDALRSTVLRHADDAARGRTPAGTASNAGVAAR
jgi:hypothetical protein